jgi:Domain of unknown function (DUF4282)
MAFEPKDLLHFDKMLTPKIIKITYYILIVILALLGIANFFSAFSSRGYAVEGILGGLVMLVVGPILVRVYCELLTVLFEIHKNLQEINERGRQRAGYAPATQNFPQPPPPAVPGWQ